VKAITSMRHLSGRCIELHVGSGNWEAEYVKIPQCG